MFNVCNLYYNDMLDVCCEVMYLLLLLYVAIVYWYVLMEVGVL